MKKIFLGGFLFCFLILSGVSQAQITVKGVVYETTGNTTLPGVNVVQKGTTNGTITDINGNYSLTIQDPNASLIYSFVGYLSQEIPINNQTSINVTLQEDVSKLDEVVVIGYGTQKKSDLTGAVSVIDTDDAKKTVTYDVAKMLQGQAPGVTVQSSGEPGGSVNIKIRGITSFNNNNPLFVIDGMIVDNPNDFAPGDIESMQVLKDASSAAIYGVRGANGVVIITTKKGVQNGDLKVKLKSLFGIQNVAKKISLTDREGYQKITNAAYLNSGQAILPGNDPTSEYYIDNVNTDWQDAAFKTGIIQNHTISFNGGSENFGYNFNTDYYKNSSYIDTPQDYERISTSLNLNGKKGKFKYGAKLGYTKSDKESFNEYNVGTSSVINLLQSIPTMPVYDENRLGGYGGTDNLTQKAITLNVIGFNNLIDNEAERNRFIGNIWGEIEIVKGLKYKISASADQLDTHTRYFVPPSDLGWYYITTNSESSLDINDSRKTFTSLDNLLTYNIEINKHKLDALVGWVQEKTNYYNHWSRGVGFEDNEISHLEYADDTSTGEYESTITGISYLSRINYNFDNKYFLTANYRQDKTSLFAKQNNTGDYFSVSGAWKLHNESFITLPQWMNTAKLRGGYGTLGNNTAGVYAYTPTTNSFASYLFGNTLAPGTIVVDATDPNLKWEDTETVNAAVELGMFDNKLQFTAEYYEKKSTDLLARVPLPLSTGTISNDWSSSVMTNAAAVKNTGFEFLLSYSNSSKEFKYNISANVGTLKNRVLKIGTDDTPINGTNSRTEVGRSIGELYVYETEGLFQSQADVDSHATQPGAVAGDVKFKDVNKDGLITDEDRTYQGVSIPKISYGLNLSGSYKNWEFSMFWQGSAGNKIYNGTYNSLMIGGLVNHHTDMLNYWTPTNTDTNIPRPDQLETNQNARASDRFIQNGNYIKLQNAQLAYNIPLKANNIVEHAKVYVSGQNLLTISKYKGYDPDFMSDGLFSRGFDYGSFPNPRTFILGVEIDF